MKIASVPGEISELSARKAVVLFGGSPPLHLASDKMPPKPDPYSTKFHRRIDVVLFVLIVVLFAILLRTSAHGQTTRIRSECENDDWWTERAEFFFPRYEFVLTSTA